tara:strand:+ start:526 stop:771 length:246 start_codon:yes stop_codon:yes gene_type:complete
MDTNFNNDNLNTLYLENIENYVILNEEMYKAILSNIDTNFLLFLFTITCFTTVLCCMKKSNNDYTLIKDVKPVKGEIINKV